MKWPIFALQLAASTLLAIIIVYTVRRLIYNHTKRKGWPLPPGPPPLPLLGSVLAVNASEPWLTYTEWRAKYGDVIYVRLLDSDVVVLNSISDATEFLEKQSQISSDRPFVATLEPYDDMLHEHPGTDRTTFRADAALGFRPMQLHRARQLIANMIDSPDEYPFHYSTFSAAVALSAVYDYEPKPRDDPKVSLMESFLRISIPALSPKRAVLLKAFPFLLHAPDWVPGSWIKREARESFTRKNRVIDSLYQHVQERMENRNYMASTMVSDHIIRMENFDALYRAEYETALKHASISAIIGSTDTTSSTLMAFTLAMVKHPRVWKRAQAEIDAVVGTDRLPDFDDRTSLPYISAIVREILRWQPIGPTGLPHATTNSHIYKGFYIPKGATIIANIWAMTRDETRYPDPESFIPERFLNAEGMLKAEDPGDFIFGFGRRICPGRHVADTSLWSAIVTMLATLDFDLAKDADGKDVHFDATFANGITHHPLHFPCRITPRGHVDKETLKSLLAK